jgi:periplasmic protein TonB
VVISLALHAALLGTIGPGWSEPVGAPDSAPALQVQLASRTPPEPDRREAQPPAAPKPRAEAPLPFPGVAPARYLRSSELDERAVPVDIVPLLYPEKAYINRIAGTVRVRVFISDQGTVDRAEVEDATPAGHFEEAALDAVRRTRFSAARKSGAPVPSQKLIEVNFDPYGPKPGER